MDKFAVCIDGAGVVGLAIAYKLASSKQLQGKDIVVVEREASFGQHTSSRNSEVIHAGIYYPTGSLKARLCVRGKELLYDHCQRHSVAHRQLGKFIVAEATGVPALESLASLAIANGVTDLVWFDEAQLHEQEPALKASHALFSPSTGIIDSHEYMQSLLHLAQNHGVQFAAYTEIMAVNRASDGFVVDTSIASGARCERYQFGCDFLVNSAGLDATALAGKIDGVDPSTIPQTHFCKGDYFSYQGASPFNHLIYPLPEANTQGLGIHATLDMAGQLRFGPDTEYIEKRTYQVDASKSAGFATAIADYFPAIEAEKLQPAYSGIRPKLAAHGEPVADFIIEDNADKGVPGLVQLFGMESPGLTASLAIGELVSANIA